MVIIMDKCEITFQGHLAQDEIVVKIWLVDMLYKYTQHYAYGYGKGKKKGTCWKNKEKEDVQLIWRIHIWENEKLRCLAKIIQGK